MVIEPTLRRIGLWSPPAGRLVLGTAIIESGLEELKQRGSGPALGFYQIEPATARWLFEQYLRRPDKAELAALILRELTGGPQTYIDELVTNLSFATAMCRLRYWPIPEALPGFTDLRGMGRYWDIHYNRNRVDEVDKFVARFTRKAGHFLQRQDLAIMQERGIS